MPFVNVPCSSNRGTTLRPFDFLSCSYSILLFGPQDFVNASSPSVISSSIFSNDPPRSTLTFPSQPRIHTPDHLALHSTWPPSSTLDPDSDVRRILLCIHSTKVVFSQKGRPPPLLCTLEETRRISSPPSSNPELPYLRTPYQENSASNLHPPGGRLS
jgi:hypothetical protein